MVYKTKVIQDVVTCVAVAMLRETKFCFFAVSQAHHQNEDKGVIYFGRMMIIIILAQNEGKIVSKSHDGAIKHCLQTISDAN